MAHTHQQNGRAELKDIHVTGPGLTFLAQAQMRYAFFSAVFLINGLRSSVNDHCKSSFEKLFHKLPDYKFLKLFGCSI